jgi:hypothetical protein
VPNAIYLGEEFGGWLRGEIERYCPDVVTVDCFRDPTGLRRLTLDNWRTPATLRAARDLIESIVTGSDWFPCYVRHRPAYDGPGVVVTFLEFIHLDPQQP